MRKVYMILMLLLTMSVASAQQKELFVLHTSDTHSRIEPLETTSADRYRGMGGVARRSAYIKQMRELHPNLLLLDCGDISQGTPYYNMFQGELEIKCMNLMGYDAMTIGNRNGQHGAYLCDGQLPNRVFQLRLQGDSIGKVGSTLHHLET